VSLRDTHSLIRTFEFVSDFDIRISALCRRPLSRYRRSCRLYPNWCGSRRWRRPIGRWRWFFDAAILQRLFSGRIALHACGPGSGLAHLTDSSVVAGPASLVGLLLFAILLCLFSGRITLHACGSGPSLAHLTDPSVVAGPASFVGLLLFAILLSLFLGSVAGETSPPGLRFSQLNHFSANANPAFGCGVSTILLRLFLRSVTLQASPPGLRLGQLNHFSAHTNPAHLGCAIPLRQSL